MIVPRRILCFVCLFVCSFLTVDSSRYGKLRYEFVVVRAVRLQYSSEVIFKYLKHPQSRVANPNDFHDWLDSTRLDSTDSNRLDQKKDVTWGKQILWWRNGRKTIPVLTIHNKWKKQPRARPNRQLIFFERSLS